MPTTYKFNIAERDQTFAFGMSNAEEMAFGSTLAIQLINADTYTGEYIVIPKAHDEVILETKDKTMQDDVTVRKVPYYETSNQTGTTVYIASEVLNG